MACVAPAVTVISLAGRSGPYSVSILAATASRSTGTPAIGGY